MYVWVTYGWTDERGQYFLVDTGAQISILPLAEYELIGEVFKTPIGATKKRVRKEIIRNVMLEVLQL
jgi:hypothetical protein